MMNINFNFEEILYRMQFDIEYPKCGWDAMDLCDDILVPLGQDILLLSQEQLGQLAVGIRDRRDWYGDLERSFKYLLTNYPETYKEFIYPVIISNHEEAHTNAINAADAINLID